MKISQSDLNRLIGSLTLSVRLGIIYGRGENKSLEFLEYALPELRYKLAIAVGDNSCRDTLSLARQLCDQVLSPLPGGVSVIPWEKEDSLGKFVRDS